MSILGFVLLFVGCGETEKEDTGTEDTGTEDTISFLGMDFVLQTAEGYEPVGSAIRLGFAADEQTLSFNAGCNHHSGSFELDGNVLTLSDLSGTEMACDEVLMDQDSWFVGFFTSSPTVQHDGDTLIVATDSVTLTFIDDEVANPDQLLTAGAWGIDTYIDGEIAMAYNLSVSPTVRFTDDGAVEVNTGCNGASGSYTATGEQLTVELDTITDAVCEGDIAEIESHILQVLTGTITYSIDASRITLDNQGIGVSGSLLTE